MANVGQHVDVNGGHIWLPSGFPLDQGEHGNVDVHVTLDNGERYIATFYTVANIQHLLEKGRTNGECANGLYMFDVNLIVIREIKRETITATIEDMIRAESIGQAMQRYVNDE